MQKNYDYEILKYWKDNNNLYINYKIYDNIKNKVVNATTYYDILDLDIDFYNVTAEEMEKYLIKLVKKNNGLEFSLPKISEASPLLEYIYDNLSNSDNGMYFLEYDEWKDLTEENIFSEKDIKKLKTEINKFSLNDYITFNNNDCKICAYGGLQCAFDNDRSKGELIFER